MVKVVSTIKVISVQKLSPEDRMKDKKGFPRSESETTSN
jgi:hypothetical protein